MIITDNYQNPYKKGLVEDSTYIKVRLKSKSCIDEIYLQVKLNNDVIEDIRFDGEACAICTSSTSILLRNAIGKKIDEIDEIIQNFINMLEEKEYNVEILGDAVVYEDISKQPNRKNCALLSWRGLEKIIEGNENNDRRQ